MNSKRFDIDARIEENIEIRPDIFLMRAYCPDIIKEARPGQFCMLKSGLIDSFDPLLRRPLSIHKTDRETGQLEFLYRIVGRGTKALSMQVKGQRVHILGPLGTGFKIREHEIPIMVGGGLGVAPLLFLAQELAGRKGVLILGAVTKSQLLRLEPFKKTGLEILISTEDGSFGNRGLVTEVLDRLLVSLESDAKANVTVVACGPMPMLRAVYHLCEAHKVGCQVSLETIMACGSGLCLGCAVKAKNGYLHVCKDGPCFDAYMLSWD